MADDGPGDLEVRDPEDPRVARRAAGVLHDAQPRGLLDAADVHVARRLARLGGETDERGAARGGACGARGARRVGLPRPRPRSPRSTRPAPAVDAAAWAIGWRRSPLDRGGRAAPGGSSCSTSPATGRRRARSSTTSPPATPRRPQVDDGRARARRSRRTSRTRAPPTSARRPEVACRRWTSVVTGGPGTGKTTTIARLLGVLMSSEGDAAAAGGARRADRQGGGPDGRRRCARPPTTRLPRPRPAATPEAATRRERIRALEARTLHRLLGWRPDSATRFRHDRANPLPYDVVVVDETSMVSLTLAARLLEAMRPEARLVLVGDADQLASVEAGAVLGDIVRGWSGHGPVQTLGPPAPVRAAHPRAGRGDQGGRRGRRAGLLIREGRGHDGDPDGWVLRPATGPDLDDLLRDHALATHAALPPRGDVTGMLAAFERHRLLCAHREGPFGVALVEPPCRAAAHGRDAPGVVGRVVRRAAVHREQQRPGLRLWNGDTGVAMPRDPGGPAARRGGRGHRGRRRARSRRPGSPTCRPPTR